MRLFDPMGLKPQDYKNKYPELETTPEFESLSGTELIFVWYFANATSPIIDILDKDKRVVEALDKSGYMPANKEQFLKLRFGEKMEQAIMKMSSFIPGARYFAWKAIKNTYRNYIEILNRDPSEFTKAVGKGEDVITEEDLGTYTNITTKITAALPDLINQLEEGFGVTINASEEEEEGSSILRNWHQDRLRN